MQLSDLENGYYDCRATGEAQYSTNDKGTDQMAVEVDVLDRDGQVLCRAYSYLYFTDKAEQMSVDRLRSLGWSSNDIVALDGLGSVTGRCQVKREIYNGEEKIKVEISTGGQPFKEQMADGEKRSFAARMAAKLNGGKPAAPRGAAALFAAAKKSNAPPSSGGDGFDSTGTDDDIPF